MRRSWSLGLGLLGLCLVGALLRHTDNRCRAQPAPDSEQRMKQNFVGVKAPPGTYASREEAEAAMKHNFVGVKAPPPFFKKDGVTKDTVLLTAKVEGYGEKEEDAVQNAVEAARDKVAQFLASNYGETQYKPSAKELLDMKIVDLDKKQIDTAKLPLSDNPQRATLEVTVTAEQVKPMRDQARGQRVNQRMRWGGLALTGLVSLLLVGGGYLRLEEATKGYYTTLLRVVALGILGVIGATLLTLWS